MSFVPLAHTPSVLPFSCTDFRFFGFGCFQCICIKYIIVQQTVYIDGVGVGVDAASSCYWTVHPGRDFKVPHRAIGSLRRIEQKSKGQGHKASIRDSQKVLRLRRCSGSCVDR